MNQSSAIVRFVPPRDAERRGARRRVFPLTVRTTDGHGRERTGIVANLSETGVFVLDDDPPESGERLGVLITLFGHHVSRQAEVVWSQRHPQDSGTCFGARFCDEGTLDGKSPYTVMLRHAERREALRLPISGPSIRESIEADLSRIRRFRHESRIERFVERYSRVGNRDPFLWSWVRRGLELTTLSCVDPALRDEILAIKLLGVMFDVVLDDVADDRQDPILLAELLRVPYERALTDAGALSPEHREIWQVACDLWDTIARAVQRLPRYPEFALTLEFDYRQLLNCMRYSLLVNQYPAHMNLVEHDLYQPHNMHMMVSATIDIMASPAFDEVELGCVREVVSVAQRMGRLGNMITTWQREIWNRDLTSGVFPLAVRLEVVTQRELWSLGADELERRLLDAKIDQLVLEEWSELHERVLAAAGRIRSVDIGGLARGLEQLLRIHLGSGGLK